MIKDPPRQAALVEREHAQLRRTTRAGSSERLVQHYPEVRGSAQQFPEVPCPRCHPFRGCSLCCSVFYGQVGPIKHLTHSAGAFLLTPVSFGSGSPWSALTQRLTFSDFRGGSAGKLNRVPVKCCKKCTNKIFIKRATSLSYFQIALKRKRFIGDRNQY